MPSVFSNLQSQASKSSSCFGMDEVSVAHKHRIAHMISGEWVHRCPDFGGVRRLESGLDGSDTKQRDCIGRVCGAGVVHTTSLQSGAM